MRFGKVYILGKAGLYDSFTREIIKTIEYSKTISYKWEWADGKPLDDPQAFFLGAVQDYVAQLFEAGQNNAGNIRNIAETVLKYHPDHVENLSNLAISYLGTNDYANALKPLLKAEKIAPQDAIVLNNIAYCYAGLGNKPNAIKYYELTIKYGDEEIKAQAKQKLTELK